ncbi:PPOX class F420-dependent oxidoreductase [Leekyejoonella antrihumi]|uniref:PPOX class F420-dependent oxidoreductase n=1 Tax=Leekyejoonella antrihumi TaxID=1660198 RepID=A0A563EAZ6_9MICO|nr:PPOX class F420-dependent oxidoreductase [Leekyejoonella antrihumi]TWP38964.1 PPOX class F420-dependent oxidoreductase [Leekyejoonella antrihumi]
MSDDSLRNLIASGGLLTLATIKRDGRPQMSLVSYAYDRVQDLVRVSITADRAKTANLRRDPRATLMIRSDDGWSYAVADADATLLPVCERTDDASVDELVDIFRRVQGEHSDWDEFRQAMVDDKRLPLHLKLTHLYGSAR